MSTTTQVLFRRGSAANNNAFAGGTGELTIDLDNRRIRIHDGQGLLGGYSGALITDVNTAISNLSGYVNTVAGGGAGIPILSGNLTTTGQTLYNDIISLSGLIGSASTPNAVFTTGIQNINGYKTFNSGFSLMQSGVTGLVFDPANNIFATYIDTFGTTGVDFNLGKLYVVGDNRTTAGSLSIDFSNRTLNSRQSDGPNLAVVDWYNGILFRYNVSTVTPSVDWQDRWLINGSSLTTVDYGNSFLQDNNTNISIDWNNYILSGNWNIQSLSVSGLPITGLYYPLNSNPSGYLSAYSQSGAYIFTTIPISGNTSQFINFPTSLGNNPYVICSLNNESGTENIFVQSSGITSAGYWAQFSNTIDSSGYVLTTLASISTSTGLATTVIIQNTTITGLTGFNSGIYITTGQTGQFYPSSNPVSYSTSGNLYSTGSLLYNDIAGLSGNLFSTGSILYNDIIGLSGNINPSVNYNFNINWASANTFYTTLTGNTNFTFTNSKDGQGISVFVINNTTGNYSGIWPNIIKWPYQIIPIQSTGIATDIYSFINLTGMIYGSVVQGF